MNSFAPPLRKVALASMLALALALALAPAAVARSHAGGTRTVAPPGNSSVSQYVETVPTGGGGRPTSTLHPGQAGVGGSGGGSSGGGTPAGGAISTGTASTLVHRGPDGAATVALARAAAPPSPANQSRSAPHAGSAAAELASPPGPSRLASLVRAVSGSGSGNALGPLLPIILITMLVGCAATAMFRRRSTT